MKSTLKWLFFVLIVLCAGVLCVVLLQKMDIPVLNPRGWVALRQRDLLITSTWLMLIVVIPVFILTFFIAWKYRASNKKAKYTPNWDNSHLLELIWWGFPCIIIVVLSIITWQSSHELDPFKPIDSSKKSMTIQVVALQWKWLFIYPEQNIAVMNFVQFPEHTPIKFEITADAPMNSFWIPQIGGQIYAMPGMKSQLNLIATETGSFRGSSANLSGKGFAGMHFIAKASSEADFDTWVQEVKQSGNVLNLSEYNKIAKPSENNPVVFYRLQEQEELYDQIVMKYMMPMQPQE